MKNYQSIQQDYDYESNEVESLINRSTPIPDRPPLYKRYALVGAVAIGFILAYNALGTSQVRFPTM